MSTPKQPKVFATRLMVGARQNLPRAQVRVLVEAPSRAAAVRAMNAAGLVASEHFLKEYGGITGNPLEVKVATSRPGVVFAENAPDVGRHGVENWTALTDLAAR